MKDIKVKCKENHMKLRSDIGLLMTIARKPLEIFALMVSQHPVDSTCASPVHMGRVCAFIGAQQMIELDDRQMSIGCRAYALRISGAYLTWARVAEVMGYRDGGPEAARAVANCAQQHAQRHGHEWPIPPGGPKPYNGPVAGLEDAAGLAERLAALEGTVKTLDATNVELSGMLVRTLRKVTELHRTERARVVAETEDWETAAPYREHAQRRHDLAAGGIG